MQTLITKVGPSFVGKPAPELNQQYKANGWKWLSFRNEWVAIDPRRVAPLLDYCDDTARDFIEGWQGKRKEAVAASVAVDAEIEIPAPPGLAYRPYQKAGIAFMRARKVSLNADVPRLGKAQPLDEPVLTPTGWRLIGELVVGDLVVGSDGLSHTVTGVFNQGRIPTFEVTMSDGTTTRCSGEHLWEVEDINRRRRVLTTNEIIRRGLRYSGEHSKPKNRIRVSDPCVFSPAASLPVDPYLLGVLIGDGSLCGCTVTLSIGAGKEAILDYVKDIHPNRVSGPHGGSCPQYHLVGEGHRKNSLLTALGDLGLRVRSSEKFIPRQYLYASIKDRKALLRGLMDTDGSCVGNRSVFHSSSLQLCEGICELVRSLGGIARLHAYTRDKSVEYQVSLATPFNPFSLSKKAARWHPRKERILKWIERIDPVAPAEQVCISVDAPDQLYITRGYNLTHNTIQTLGLANTYDRPLRILIVPPANAKVNWTREAQKWLIHKTSIAYAEGDDCPDVDFLAINHTILSRHIDKLCKLRWDIVAIDEAHFFGNPDSQRSRAMARLDADLHFVFLTGTPIYTRPIQLFPMLQRLDPDRLGANKWRYLRRYCGAKKNEVTGHWELDGFSNEEELQHLMRSRFMIRREKHDVVDEIPTNRQTLMLPREGLVRLIEKEKSLFQKKFDDMVEGLKEGLTDDQLKALAEFDRSTTDLDVIDETEPVASIRRQLAIAKIPMCLDFIEEQLLTDDKVVVFAHHREVVKSLHQQLSKYNPAIVIGGMSTTKRQEAIDRFRDDPTCRVIVGNIVSMGSAISLAAADHAIFCELSWIPSDVDQAEERIWDPTKTTGITISRLVLEDSLEARLAYVLEQRQEKIERMMVAKYLKN